MHDIRKIVRDPKGFDRSLERRGIDPQSSVLLEIDRNRRNAIAAVERLRAERNAASKSAGEARACGDHEAFERLRGAAARMREEIALHEERLHEEEQRLRGLMLELPNTAHDDVPDGSR